MVPEVLFITLGKPFLYRRKSRVPKTVACGAPCITFTQLETLLLLSIAV